MLSIDLAVNGRQIGHVAAINKGPSETPGLDSYYWQVRVDDTLVPATSTHGFVEHRRSDGARRLVCLIFEAMEW